MGFNPMMLMKIQTLWSEFSQRHPKLPTFFQAVGANGIVEGSIIEMTVTTPDGKTMKANMKVMQEDLDAIAQLRG